MHETEQEAILKGITEYLIQCGFDASFQGHEIAITCIADIAWFDVKFNSITYTIVIGTYDRIPRSLDDEDPGGNAGRSFWRSLEINNPKLLEVIEEHIRTYSKVNKKQARLLNLE